MSKLALRTTSGPGAPASPSSNYQDKGFKSGFFQQWDGEYYRHSMMLDHTPATLESVIDRFQRWCTGGACPYKTVNIQVDKKVVRKVSP